MIDAKKLLDQFLGSGNAAGPWGGQDRRPSGGAAEGAGGLGGMLGGLGSGLGGVLGQSGGVGGTIGKVQDYARQNPLLAGALAGGLASVLLGSKGGRKLAGGALKYGGIAAVAGLAYKAYRDYQAGQQAEARPAPANAATASEPLLLPPPSDSPFATANAPQGEANFALALVSAMVAAAKADGHVDEAERQAILGRLSEGGLDAEEQAFLARELSGPADIDKIVAAARTREQAVELYAAALMAIVPDHPAERAWLAMLAARLGLEPDLAATIERTVAQAAA
ncbi:tellurite resistance TerB family protein [Prosthecomicrobium pneumaticum]|uniref:Uncharacterized membrane protein YebE (DUF533 family) n=1 Tax=Prosthecomicrobium pneumaticum TaxID=81895 RepID=A0A7W9CV68_9HYPH|nr:DUF533 domain-containing protein [Prosthecomicrobium pneumaticum]MBB5752497.1 uncharacterized membrane protein YebE (DUF533 family) [Prosthecomicrobium pneumaticum]